jgi:hypothetical protein
MTDQIVVDFNSCDARGLVPAARRRVSVLPAIGSIISAVDDEENRCLARVVAIEPRSEGRSPLPGD